MEDFCFSVVQINQSVMGFYLAFRACITCHVLQAGKLMVETVSNLMKADIPNMAYAERTNNSGTR